MKAVKGQDDDAGNQVLLPGDVHKLEIENAISEINKQLRELDARKLNLIQHFIKSLL